MLGLRLSSRARIRATAASVAASLRRLPMPLAAAASFSTTPPAIPTITSPAATNPAEEQLVNLEINGKSIAVPAYSTILEAARAAGAFVPTLCAHPSIPGRATCRICLVELETDQGMKKVVGPASATDARRVEKLVPITKLVPACVTQVKPGQRIHTHSPDVLENVRFVLQLLRAKHPNTCQTCDANGQCTFQDLLYRYQVEDIAPAEIRKTFEHHHEWDSGASVASPTDSQTLAPSEGAPYNAITFDPDKCIKCGRCVAICQKIQGIGAIGFVGRGADEQVSTVQGLPLDRTKCIECGQCAAICPTGAMRERHDIFEVIDALQDKERLKVAAVAPSVRVAISEEFDLPPGKVSMGQIVAGLKQLGFDYVFDTNFAADLTIMEEGTELLSRLKKEPGAGPLPMFTSCCPGWINLVEKSYPELIPHLSSCKSPQGMMGAAVKNVWAPRMERDPADVVSVSIMPCTAKKDEAHRPADRAATYSAKLDRTVPNNDYVLTTRELGRLFRLHKIALPALEPQAPDDPLGESTGAAVLFGATGGVMEAALRTAYELASGGQSLPKIELNDIRGLQGVKSARVCIPSPDGKGPGAVVRVGVVHGTAETRALLDRMKAGDETAKFDFVEVMACRGGCIGGGGQSKSYDPFVLQKRMAQVYSLDERSAIRKSHENPSIKKFYEEELGKPGGHLSHKLLHTHYSDRSQDTK